MRIGGRWMAVAGAAVVVIGGGAGAAYAAMSSSGPAYRLATATSAQVTSTLNEVGTLMPAQQADVSFPVTGTVATVTVSAGQQVTAGQALGTLDTAQLRASLTAAQSTLANANLKVSHDVASQDTAASGSAPATPESSPSATLQPLQQAVLSSQGQADAALALAKTALTQAGQACGPSPSPSPTPTRTEQAHSGSAPPVTCLAATQQVLADETAAQHALQALSARLSALAAALNQAIPGSGTGDAVPGGSSSTTGGRGSPGSSGSGNPGGSVSAAQLAADQASADSAAAQVTVAQQDLNGATVVSPLSGTVISVTAKPGSDESAGSTEFEVAGLNSWQVQTQVPVSNMPQLKNGQPASVLPDGSGVPLSGAVVTIGLMPTPDSNPVTYPVTVGLAGQPSGLHQNGYAAVTITTARTTGVSVPTSAVHYSSPGGPASVTVYAAGETRVTRVTVGTKGPVMTRVTSGLAAGQQVVLANVNAPLPNSNPSGQFGQFGQFGGPGSGGVHVRFIGPGGAVRKPGG